MEVAYRTDASAVARERARRWARLRDLEARFTDVFWRELATRLGVARSRGWSASSVAEELVEVARRIASIESVLSRWTGIERIWTHPAPSAPIGPGSHHATVDDETLETAIAREQLARWLEAIEVPMPLDVRVRPRGAGVTWALATSAPRGAGRVTIEPERLLDDLRKMAGVLTDIEVGDDRFDGVFLVQGHEPTARALLDGETRRRLLGIGARCARLRIELGEGTAVVQLHAAPDRRLLDDAIEVLTRLRRAPVRRLRLDE